MRKTKIRMVSMLLAATMLIGDTGSAVYAAEIDPMLESDADTEESTDGETNTEGNTSEENSETDENSEGNHLTEDSEESNDDNSNDEGEDAASESGAEESGTDGEDNFESNSGTSDSESNDDTTDSADSDTEKSEENTESVDKNDDADIVITDEFKNKLDEYVYGSDGIAYEGVEYITYKAFLALTSEGQDAYLKMCEEVAEVSEYVESGDVVLSTNEDGDVSMCMAISIEELSEMVQDISNEESDSEDDDVTGETEETSNDVDLDDNVEEVQDDQSDDNEGENSLSDEEITSETDLSSENIEIDSAEDLTEEAREELGIDNPIAENEEELEALDIEEEDIELAEDIPLDIDIDLTETDENGMTTGTFDTSLSALNMQNYFYDQLDASSKKIYNAAKGKLPKGKNSFTVKSYVYSSYIAKALNAIMMTYSWQMGWLGRGSKDGVRISWKYSCRSGYSTTVKVSKSKYYSKSLASAANKKVNAVVTAAYKYAKENYSARPTYGMVKYFDNWLCANNYYSCYYGVAGSPYYASQNTAKYFYCHSPYGAILKGIAVCESYAMAMTMLLDKAGITNMYAVGPGHAWNYVYMPDGKWYLQDTTWNDTYYGTDNPSQTTYSQNYLLKADDTSHIPDGNYWGNSSLTFPTRSTTAYTYNYPTEAISLNVTGTKIISPKKKFTLSVTNRVYKNYRKSWSSSNSAVASVSSKGKVTTKKPGKAVITCNIGGMTATMTVVVYKFTSLKFADNKKSTCKKTVINTNTVFGDSDDTKTYYINVNQSSPVFTAEELKSKLGMSGPSVKSSKTSVATATASIAGNQIALTVTPHKIGVTTITIKFAGKTCKIKYTVKQQIQADWFEQQVDSNCISYDTEAGKDIAHLSYKKGKAVILKIKKTASCPKGVTYKIVYKNNKKRGLASATVVGTKYYTTDPTVYTYRIQ